MSKTMLLALVVLLWLPDSVSLAQTPPSAAEIASYKGLHAAAHRNDAATLRALLAKGTNTI